MPTIRQICDDVILHLGELQDDAEVSIARVAYWVKMWADRLLSQRLSKTIPGGIGNRETGAWDTAFILDVSMDDDMQYPYFTLPRSILDLNKDRGVRAITYVRNNIPDNCPKDGEKVQFSWTTYGQLQALAGSTYQRPSPYRPYFFRMNTRISDEPGMNRIYMPGVSPSVRQVRVILQLALPPLEDIDLDDTLEMPDDLIGPLTLAVVNMGRMALTVPTERLMNDGRDAALGQPPPGLQASRTVSVNDPIMNTQFDN